MKIEICSLFIFLLNLSLWGAETNLQQKVSRDTTATTNFNEKDLNPQNNPPYKGDLGNIKFLDVVIFFNTNTLALGFEKERLTEYAKLRFKNNFVNYKFVELPKTPDGVVDSKNIQPREYAYIFINIETVGDDYPIAYFVNLKVCTFPCPRSPRVDIIYSQHILGYSSLKVLKERIFEHEIDKLMQALAMQYFTLRGEL